MKERIMHCGIDVGLKNHAVCLLDGSQKIVKKYFIRNNIEGFMQLEGDLEKDTRICLEPTGIYSINIFLYLKNKNYDIRFCKTDSSHDFRQAMFANKKHDRFDALALAKYRIVNEAQTFDGMAIIEKLGAEENYNPGYRVLSELTEEYLSCMEHVKVLKTKIKNIIDLRFPEAIQIFPCDRGCKTVRKALLHPKEAIISGIVQLTRLKEFQELLINSIGQYDMKRMEFEKLCSELDLLEKKTEKLVIAIKGELFDLGYSFLFNYHGLNTIGIAVLAKEIRNIKRFYRYSANGCFNKKKSLKAFKKFLGISVTSNQSGTKEGGHALAKNGNMKIRQILFLMAMKSVQTDPGKFNIVTRTDLNPVKFKELYNHLVAGGTKKLIALTKIMNKISTDLFFILKNNTAHNDQVGYLEPNFNSLTLSSHVS